MKKQTKPTSRLVKTAGTTTAIVAERTADSPETPEVVATTAYAETPTPASSITPVADVAATGTTQPVAIKKANGLFAGIGTMAQHGIPAGLRRNQFQDALLVLNEREDFRLTDAELAAIMDAEHPTAGIRIASRVSVVGLIRKFYNAGRHGKHQQARPSVRSVAYGPNKQPLAEATTSRRTVATQAKTKTA